MPTPNQTTPDSPERVPESHQRISKVLRFMAHRQEAISLHEWSEFVNDIGGLMLADLETTRLAEALKECCAAWFGSTDLDVVSRAMQNAQRVLNTQPAPISGAKKE